ncbi:uncharacterized protein BJ171DRAFT_478171 [Polychytrium aggregatum]|uniref:uncharacterized protein n=1 Tax=Polychytrium aggregatum TaxID=110093 RepID=UPI0022FF20DE|nr:uncharacterized protein BJ171DRAFT_478171 [Polychytrium aggregatum]KAI9197238.1 hypothetical protein BJ171DRAFT_478171 [Polychytrium aggregatum]
MTSMIDSPGRLFAPLPSTLLMNEHFQMSLNFARIEKLLLVCRCPKPFLMSRLTRFCRDEDKCEFSWLVPYNERGSVSVMYILAIVLDETDTKSERESLPRHHIRRQQVFMFLPGAAAAGYPMEPTYLDFCYMQGLHMNHSTASKQKADEWLSKAAAQGFTYAQAMLEHFAQKTWPLTTIQRM